MLLRWKKQSLTGLPRFDHGLGEMMRERSCA